MGENKLSDNKITRYFAEFRTWLDEILWHKASIEQAGASSYYHYMPPEAITGVLRGLDRGNLRIWQSSIASMNDPQEFSHGRRRFRIAAEEYMKGPDPVDADLEDGDLNNVQRSLDDIDNVLPIDVFAYSMSSVYDSIPQWVGYSNKGLGYALVLNADKMREHYSQKILPIIYQNSVKDELTDEFAAYFVGLTKLLRTELSDPETGLNVFNSLKRIAAIFSSCMKPEGFEYEAEVRILDVGLTGSTTQFRHSGTRLVPYIESDLKREMVDGIMLGPSQKSTYDQLALSSILSKYGLADLKIYTSGHEFRP